jgi:hypothetical protein
MSLNSDMILPHGRRSWLLYLNTEQLTQREEGNGAARSDCHSLNTAISKAAIRISVSYRLS